MTTPLPTEAWIVTNSPERIVGFNPIFQPKIFTTKEEALDYLANGISNNDRPKYTLLKVTVEEV